jgi:hypothetical protein
MAVQTDARAGVRLGDVHHAWRSAGLGIDAVAAANGWRREEVATIELYRGRDVRHAFPTWLQLRELFSARFELLDCTWPEYEIGDRCPIAAFRVRPGAA